MKSNEAERFFAGSKQNMKKINKFELIPYRHEPSIFLKETYRNRRESLKKLSQ